MIELMVLGFLADDPLHGYELRRRMEQLHGYARRISDGTLYPAIARLVGAGLLERKTEDGAGGPFRQVLALTDTGRADLIRRLRDADGHDVTDGDRFFVVLAFLSHVTDRQARKMVLRRRLEFLSSPRPFFDDALESLSARRDDPYRKGMLSLAKLYNRAQRDWLREMLAEHDQKEDS